MSLTREDIQSWQRLGWWQRRKKRSLYYGKSSRWAYENLEWGEYVFYVCSNCTYVILSGAGSLFPSIMKTPVADRDKVMEGRKKFIEDYGKGRKT